MYHSFLCIICCNKKSLMVNDRQVLNELRQLNYKKSVAFYCNLLVCFVVVVAR